MGRWIEIPVNPDSPEWHKLASELTGKTNMTQEYFALKQHPDVISHIGGVIEIPSHVSTADIPINYWCENWPCKYAVKASGEVSKTCPQCGKDTVASLPF